MTVPAQVQNRAMVRADTITAACKYMRALVCSAYLSMQPSAYHDQACDKEGCPWLEHMPTQLHAWTCLQLGWLALFETAFTPACISDYCLM